MLLYCSSSSGNSTKSFELKPLKRAAVIARQSYIDKFVYSRKSGERVAYSDAAAQHNTLDNYIQIEYSRSLSPSRALALSLAQPTKPAGESGQ